MKKKFKVTAAALLIGLLVSCGGKKETVQATNTQQPFQELERIIERSNPVRPDWTINEPESQGSRMFFVGLSEKYATERAARDSARREAAKSVVSYLGTSVKDRFQEITASFGLSTDITNPTRAAKGFTDILSANVTKKMKPQKWYYEKYQTKLGEIYYKYYVLAFVPKDEIEKAFDDSIDSEKDKIKDKMKKAHTAQAKQQLQNALNAFDKLKDDNITK